MEQYRKGLEKLLTVFNSARYATCDRLLKNLEILMLQIISTKAQTVSERNQSAFYSELLRIQELQFKFYGRSHSQLNDLILQTPKRTRLNRLEKFL